MIHDVTRTLHPGIPVWPGDVEFEMSTVEAMGFRSSAVRMSLHTGTHIDAPRHRFPQGNSVDSLGPFLLSAYYGIDDDPRGKAFITDGPISGDLARELVEKGVRLVCTSSISIDAEGSTEAHDALLGSGIPVIENLDLAGVPRGTCYLLAFPLKFENGDGSPVRVILADAIEDLFGKEGKNE